MDSYFRTILAQTPDKNGHFMWSENKQYKLRAREKDCFWGRLTNREHSLSVFNSSDSPTPTAHGIQPDCRGANALLGRLVGPHASMEPFVKCGADNGR